MESFLSEKEITELKKVSENYSEVYSQNASNAAAGAAAAGAGLAAAGCAAAAGFAAA